MRSASAPATSALKFAQPFPRFRCGLAAASFSRLRYRLSRWRAGFSEKNDKRIQLMFLAKLLDTRSAMPLFLVAVFTAYAAIPGLIYHSALPDRYFIQLSNLAL